MKISNYLGFDYYSIKNEGYIILKNGLFFKTENELCEHINKITRKFEFKGVEK